MSYLAQLRETTGVTVRMDGDDALRTLPEQSSHGPLVILLAQGHGGAVTFTVFFHLDRVRDQQEIENLARGCLAVINDFLAEGPGDRWTPKRSWQVTDDGGLIDPLDDEVSTWMLGMQRQ